MTSEKQWTAITQVNYANEPEKVLKNINRILESLDPYLNTNFLTFIFVYALQTTEVKEQQLKIILKELPNKLDDKVMNTYDMILDRGRTYAKKAKHTHAYFIKGSTHKTSSFRRNNIKYCRDGFQSILNVA